MFIQAQEVLMGYKMNSFGIPGESLPPAQLKKQEDKSINERTWLLKDSKQVVHWNLQVTNIISKQTLRWQQGNSSSEELMQIHDSGVTNDWIMIFKPSFLE